MSEEKQSESAKTYEESVIKYATLAQLKTNDHVVKLLEALNIISINVDPDSWDSDSDGRIAQRALKEFNGEEL